MMKYISEQDLAALIRFADDDRENIDPEVIEGLNNLTFAVMRNAARRLSGAQKRNRMLTERIERQKEKNAERILVNGYPDTAPGFDSTEIANGLIYQLQQYKTYQMGKTKVILLLYEMYASWLASKKERLFREHPVATEFGPQFWSAFKHISPYAKVPYETWKGICEKNDGVAAFIKNVAAKYYDIKNSDLEESFKKAAPYQNSTKEKNGGKWNKEISDQDIFAWRSPKP